MRVIAAWFALVVLASLVAGTATSCSINHRSDQLACTTADDCEPGLLCTDGVCTSPGGLDAGFDGRPVIDSRPGIDAAPDARPPIDAGPMEVCPQGCTSCDFGEHKVCHIDCSAPTAACGAQLKCPPTWNCDIDCNTNNSCRNGITCAASQDCDITCSGANSCRNVVCGQGACAIACDGPGSCRGVSCGESCACDVTCDGMQSCAENIICSSLQCRRFAGGCNSELLSCDTCP